MKRSEEEEEEKRQIERFRRVWMETPERDQDKWVGGIIAIALIFCMGALLLEIIT